MKTLAPRDLLPHFTPEQVLQQCGYHEAGHAFCYAILGVRQNGVSVGMRKRWLSSGYTYTALTHLHEGAKEAADQANVAIGTLAGPAAEALYLSKNYRLDYDQTLAWFMNHEMSASQDMRDFAEELARARPRYSRARAISDTSSLIRRHWRRIDKIAKKAIARGHLTGDQVRRMAGV